MIIITFFVGTDTTLHVASNSSNGTYLQDKP